MNEPQEIILLALEGLEERLRNDEARFRKTNELLNNLRQTVYGKIIGNGQAEGPTMPDELADAGFPYDQPEPPKKRTYKRRVYLAEPEPIPEKKKRTFSPATLAKMRNSAAIARQAKADRRAEQERKAERQRKLRRKRSKARQKQNLENAAA